MALRIMLIVRPGAFFSQPPLLPKQEPVGHQAESHVMVPALPGPRLEVVESDFSFGLLEGLLDAVPQAGLADER